MLLKMKRHYYVDESVTRNMRQFQHMVVTVEYNHEFCSILQFFPVHVLYLFVQMVNLAIWQLVIIIYYAL